MLKTWMRAIFSPVLGSEIKVIIYIGSVINVHGPVKHELNGQFLSELYKKRF
jgi:hypothetical protein